MYLIHYILVLTKELNEVFLKLIYKWDEDPRASRILRQIFEYVSCKIHGNHRLQRKSSTWGPRIVHPNNNVVLNRYKDSHSVIILLFGVSKFEIVCTYQRSSSIGA